MKNFEDYNPIALFVYYACVLLPVMFCKNPVLLCISFAGAAVFYFIRRGKAKDSVLFFAVPLIAFILNPIFSHKGVTVLFFLNSNPVTLESALFGLSSGIMIGAVIAWFSTFTSIFTSDKLLYVFGAVSPKLALILSMTLRYIPLFKKQTEKTNMAQKALGLYKDDSLMDRISGGMRVFSVMVSWALENGVITADSMTARGYGVGKRSFFAIFTWRKSDYILLSVSLALAALAVAAIISGNLNYTWYPSIIAAERNPINIAAYIAYGLLAFLPTYIQIKEELHWKSLQSEI